MTEELKQAFDEGWRMAAEWAVRDDLVPDMESPQYAKERCDRLAALTQRPAAQATPSRDAREAEQRTRMQARLSSGKATADFDLPAPNDDIQQATPEPTSKHRPSPEWYAAMIKETMDDDFVIGPSFGATPEPVREPEHHRQAWAALTEACQRVANTDSSSAADLTRAIDRFSDVLMGDTRPAPGVPEGFALVPVEPTWEMRIAASTAYREARDGHYTARMEQAANCWRLMLAAAQAKK